MTSRALDSTRFLRVDSVHHRSQADVLRIKHSCVSCSAAGLMLVSVSRGVRQLREAAFRLSRPSLGDPL